MAREEMQKGFLSPFEPVNAGLLIAAYIFMRRRGVLFEILDERLFHFTISTDDEEYGS